MTRDARQLRWLVGALVLEATLVLADARAGPMAGSYVIAPLLLAVVARPGITGAVGALAVALAALSGLWDGHGRGVDYVIRLAIVACGSVIAYWSAVRRCRAETEAG